MSALKASTESFIALLLDVSGKARPSDIQGVSPDEASAALQEYASTHSGEVRFEGDVLHRAVVGLVFEPEVDPYAQPAQDIGGAPAADAVSDPYAVAEDPFANPYASASPLDDSLPAHEAAMFGTAAAPQPVFPEADAIYESAPTPVAEPTGQPATIESFPESADDFLDLPPLDAADAGESEPGDAKKKPGIVLVVLVVVLVVVVGLAAAFYLGAFETFGLSL